MSGGKEKFSICEDAEIHDVYDTHEAEPQVVNTAQKNQEFAGMSNEHKDWTMTHQNSSLPDRKLKVPFYAKYRGAIGPKSLNLLVAGGAIACAIWYWQGTMASNPVLNSPKDITPAVLDGISNGTLSSLTINYPLTCSAGGENLERDRKLTERHNPFLAAYVRKPYERISFPIIAGPEATSADCMFAGMETLREGPMVETRNVTSMRSMFAWDKALESVPLYDTSAVTDMSFMFQHAESLKEVPPFNTVQVTDMRGMFARASSIKEIPAFNTMNVTKIKWMFSGAEALEKVPLLNTARVTDFDRMFAEAKALKEVPLFDTSLAFNMNGMFERADSLSSKTKEEWSTVYDFTFNTKRHPDGKPAVLDASSAITETLSSEGSQGKQ